jgi:hypothetical protein
MRYHVIECLIDAAAHVAIVSAVISLAAVVAACAIWIVTHFWSVL